MVKHILTSLLMASTCSTVLAQPIEWDGKKALKLDAYSRTAMSITGDIVLSPTSLKTQNGAQFPWKIVNQKDGRYVFKMDSDNNPALLYGNTLCGDEPIRYAVMTFDPKTKYGSLEVFQDNPENPDGEGLEAKSFCASFSYFIYKK